MNRANQLHRASDGDLNDTRHESEESTVVSDWQLWFGVMGGAIAWLGHLLLSYAISEFGCVSRFGERAMWGISGVAWMEIAVTVIFLGIAIVATVVAQRNKRAFSGAVDAARVEPNDPRVFMARSGVLASGLFVFITAVQALPILYYLHDC